jgi:hypothetical protein
MTEHPFSLIPFAAPTIPAINLGGRISLQNNLLDLHYLLVGRLDAVRFPPPSPSPIRNDDLWKGTCFEFFLAVKDEPGYWEFNMSPSGDWNVYRMDAYRRIGFREETEIPQLPFAIKRDLDRFSLDVTVDLTSLVRPEQELQMGITAIIQGIDGVETYWALAHPAPQADFHARESFTLALAGQNHPLGQPALDG